MSRPTAYRPEYCQRVIEMGRQGYTKAMMAGDLGVCRVTLDSWAARHPEFLYAITRARDLALAFMEAKGMAALNDPRFNAALYGTLMAAMFPADYSKRRLIELTGRDGAPIQTDCRLRVEFVASPSA